MRDASEVRTEKLYYDDAYAVEFTATVISAEGGDVVLDRTLFFPEEGGQEPDTGVLGGFRVKDVQIRDGEIHHYLDPGEGGTAADWERGASVKGIIDRERRFSNMQQHSGEHLFSGVVHRRYGFDNVGFHLSGREVTLDFDGVIPAGDLDGIEEEVNRAITADIPSRIHLIPKGQTPEIEYRSKLDLDDEIRIVEFPGIDACACCAPHVRRSGEIGLLKVVGMIRWKSGVRVSILCGGRALRYLQEEHRIVTEAANFLTTSAAEVVPQIRRMKEEIRELAAGKAALAGKLLELRAESIPEEAEHALIFTAETDPKAARETVTRLAERHPGYAAVFTGSDGAGYSYVIGSRERDVREICALFRERYGGKGGGRPGFVQGAVAASEEELRKTLQEEH